MLWRDVEAQHVIATLKLTDSRTEHEVLEALLEASKPPLPAEAKEQHYLLFTPFRYLSPYPSRFRRATDPGVWYGAQELRTPCAETAYWRWRFLMDSEGLRDQALYTEHTFFQARVRGRCADLTAAPWKSAARAWTQKTDYSARPGAAHVGLQDHALGRIPAKARRAIRALRVRGAVLYMIEGTPAS